MEIDITLDKVQLEYIIELVTLNELDEGPWIGTEILGILGEALSELVEAEEFRKGYLDNGTGLS